MRARTARMDQILQSQQVIRSNLFTFRLNSGAEFYWTDGDVDVYSRGRNFSSTGPTIKGAKYHLTRGIQVDTLDLTVTIKPTDLIMGLPWPVAVRSGALDAAVVTIERAYMLDWGEEPEVLLIFQGEISNCGGGDQTVPISVKSDASKLDTKVPVGLFQAGCSRRLYAGRCTVSRNEFSRNGAIVSVTNRYEMYTTLGLPDGFFSLGDVLFTSGANTGVRRSIKKYVEGNGTIVLSYPLTFDLQIGDTFIAAAGCDKSRGSGGCAKFGAGVELRFNGTPYVPPPESIV